MKKLTIQKMHLFAKKREGECLSIKYINARSKLKWKCRNNHIWQATADSICNKKTWCSKCADLNSGATQRLNIVALQNTAQERGGKCLSKNYINSKSKYEWMCSEGHVWFASACNVRHGTWCPKCTGRLRFTIKDMEEFASKKEGFCLSKVYKNQSQSLKWRCKLRHVWYQKPAIILKGVWCPKCAGKGLYTIKYINKIVKKRGGRCLSDKYISAHSLLLWQCSFGHIWKANMNNVVNNNRWCPECSHYLKERTCRAFFEQVFAMEFPNTKPLWLINDRGNRMELDGYNENLKLAFEHQGKQHYSKDSYFIKSNANLLKRIADDRLKQRLCKERGIVLVVIPDLFTQTKIEDLKRHVEIECLKQGYKKLPKGYDKIIFNSSSVYFSDFHKKIDQLIEIAKQKGGKLLTENYRGVDEKLKFQCKLGHVWEATPYKIKTGRWCKICMKKKVGKEQRLKIELLHEIARGHRGRLLSKDYLNAKALMQWQCNKGHIWFANTDSVKNKGTWCRVCSNLARHIAIVPKNKFGNYEEKSHLI
jgi:hypothetical protein